MRIVSQLLISYSLPSLPQCQTSPSLQYQQEKYWHHQTIYHKKIPACPLQVYCWNTKGAKGSASQWHSPPCNDTLAGDLITFYYQSNTFTTIENKLEKKKLARSSLTLPKIDSMCMQAGLCIELTIIHFTTYVKDSLFSKYYSKYTIVSFSNLYSIASIEGQFCNIGNLLEQSPYKK